MGEVELKDEVHICIDCGHEFIYSRREQQFLKEREAHVRSRGKKKVRESSFRMERPKRCKVCVQRHRLEKEIHFRIKRNVIMRYEREKPEIIRLSQEIERIVKELRQIRERTSRGSTIRLTVADACYVTSCMEIGVYDG